MMSSCDIEMPHLLLHSLGIFVVIIILLISCFHIFFSIATPYSFFLRLLVNCFGLHSLQTYFFFLHKYLREYPFFSDIVCQHYLYLSPLFFYTGT